MSRPLARRQSGPARARAGARLRAGLVLLMVCAGISVTFGSDRSSLTVYNKTGRFLHVIIQGKSFLYISPGASARYETEGAATVAVTAFYAPGQGVVGSASRSFRIYPWRPESTGCDWTTTTCTTRPSSGGPALWEVAPDTLQS